MAVNRDKVKKQMADSAERGGKFRYLPKDSTNALRILEYIDAECDQMFAQPMVEHREVDQKGGKSLGICKRDTFGQPCVFCKINQKLSDVGEERKYNSRTRYVVNAADINEDKQEIRLWVVPVSVFDQLAEYVTDDEWADVLEPKKGYAFAIKREGAGLDTTYSVMAKKNPYPVDAKLAKQTTDPLDTIPNIDLGVECSNLGYELEDLFDDSELEEIKIGKSDKKDKSSKKRQVSDEDIHGGAPGDDEISVGSPVQYESEKEVCLVKSIDGDDVEIEDSTGETFEVAMGDLTLVEETKTSKKKAAKKAVKKTTKKKAVQKEEKVIEVKSRVNYLDEDGVCTVKSIKGDDVIIEDENGDQFDVLMGDLVLDDIPF